MKKPQLVVYDLFMLVLCIISLTIVLVQLTAAVPAEIENILNTFDFIICLVFMYDFLRSFYLAESKREYMKWGWIDLLSSIPTMGWLRLGRFARLLRVFRLLRGIKSAKLIYKFIMANRAKATFLSASLLFFVIFLVASITILSFEKVPNANITSAKDAIWWSFVTITTVGYGDFYPVSTSGRILAAILMVVGIGLFGTYTGLVGAWFVNPVDESEDRLNDVLNELKAVRQELHDIKKELKKNN